MKLADIGPSPWNRKRFDEAELNQLAADIKERGVLQPILVRKTPIYTHSGSKAGHEAPWHYWIKSPDGTTVQSGGFKTELDAAKYCGELSSLDFELIAGERRWRAAKIAGLTEIPAIVVDADDRQTLEAQAVENVQRVNLNAIDEAEKFAQLRDVYKNNGAAAKEAVELVAKRVKISPSLVYERLRLLTLGEAARDAALSGRLPASHANELAKIDDEKVQAKLLKKVLNPDSWDAESSGVLSFRKTKSFVETAAGEVKFEKEWTEAREKYLKQGLRALTVPECRKVLGYGSQWVQSVDYIGANSSCHVSTSKVTKKWKELLGKSAPVVVMGRSPSDGKNVEMYPAEEAREALKKLGLFKEGDEASKAEEAQRRAVENRKLEEEHERRMVVFRELLGKAGAVPEGPAIWQFLFGILAEDYEASEHADEVCMRRGIKIPEDFDGEELLKKNFAKANGKELRAVVVELFFARFRPYSHSSDWSDELKGACKTLGLKLPPWKVQTAGTAGEEKPVAKPKAAPAKGKAAVTAKGGKGVAK